MFFEIIFLRCFVWMRTCHSSYGRHLSHPPHPDTTESKSGYVHFSGQTGDPFPDGRSQENRRRFRKIAIPDGFPEKWTMVSGVYHEDDPANPEEDGRESP
jgi:hypothetical protein